MMRFNSIHTRLTAVALIFIAGTSIIMGVIGIRLTSLFLDKRYHDNFKILTEYFVKNAELGMVLRDSNMLNELAVNMLEVDDISRVKIYDTKEILMADAQKKETSDDHAMVKRTIKAMRFNNNNDMLLPESNLNWTVTGRAEVTYSLANIQAIKQRIAYLYLFFAAIFSLFPVLWFYFVAKSISAPLTRLLEVCRVVSTGNLEIRADTSDSLKEVRTLGVTFNEMLNAIRQQKEKAEKAHAKMLKQNALAEVGKFSMMVAHEIKNPLAVIKGSLDIIKNPNTAPKTRGTMLRYVEEDVARINRLVEEFLEFSRPAPPHFVQIDMNHLVRDLMEKFKVMTTNCQFKLSIETTPAMTLCDPNLMERALLNVVKNAVQFIKTEPCIEIITMSGVDQWKVCIKDNGKGISKDKLEDIFKPFYTTRARGTGLGLAITRDIIAGHGGTISAGNRREQGACFEITLPLTDTFKPAYLRGVRLALSSDLSIRT